MTNLTGTFKCAHSRCKTFPFIHNIEKISRPKRSIKIPDHFTCASANVIYCPTCTYCKNYSLVKQEDDSVTDSENTFATQKERTRTHLDQLLDTLISSIILNSIQQFAAFTTTRQFGKPLNSRKEIFSFKSALLIPTVLTSVFHSTTLFLFSRHHFPTNSVTPFSAYKPTHNPQFLQSL